MSYETERLQQQLALKRVVKELKAVQGGKDLQQGYWDVVTIMNDSVATINS